MLDLLPSAFDGDPLGGIGNQAAHALVVGAGGWLILAAVLPQRAALAAVLLAYAVWEAWQIALGGGFEDGFTDWAFVASGAVLARVLWRGDVIAARTILAALIAAALAYMATR